MTTIVDQLHDIARSVPNIHNHAWWPAIAAPRASRVGANTNRVGGPALQPGDSAVMDRYREFITELNALNKDIKPLLIRVTPRLAVRDTARAMATMVLSERSDPGAVVAVVRNIADVVRRASTAEGEEQIIRTVRARVERLSGHQEAILNRPRVMASVPCKNAGERTRCTGWATNHTRQLCRSCENHEQYKRVRKRTVRAGIRR